MSFLQALGSILLLFVIFFYGSLYSEPSLPEEVAAPISKSPESTENLPSPTATSTENLVAAEEEPSVKKKESRDGNLQTTAQKPVVQEVPASITPTKTPISITPTPLSELNEKTRAALVNIFCTTKAEGPLKPITSSGIFIDPRGVILLNAHAAQYYLLRNYRQPGFMDCLVRTGSPAKISYRAEPLYISPLWIADNKQIIREEKQTGTGEHDFAFLLVTESLDGSSLPSSFPFLPLIEKDSEIEDYPEANYLLSGYPAGFLGGTAILRDLYQLSTVSQVKKFFTFKENTLDLISFGGTILAQRGASGGAAVSDLGGKIAGIIVTTSEAKETGDRDLHVLAGSHINRSLREDTGYTVKEFLSGNLQELLLDFSTFLSPRLTAALQAEIEK